MGYTVSLTRDTNSLSEMTSEQIGGILLNFEKLLNFGRVHGIALKLTYLAAECRNRSENLTNRKLTIFYIEVMSQLFSQLRQKIFFSGF